MKTARLTLLVILLASATSTLTNHHRVIYCGAPEVLSVYNNSLSQLDSRGRLPLSGEISGEINNVYQLVRHPGRPAELGCGDQAQFVYAKLEAVPGWTFELKYEYGFKSPILFPHQWIEGRGPQGQTADIDPWADRVEIR